MPGTNLTAVEAAARATLVSVTEQHVTLDLTTSDSTFATTSRIAFIVSGRIVRIDTVKSLMQQTEGRYVVQLAVSGNAVTLGETIASAFADLQCRVLSDQDIRVESPEPVRVGPLVRLIEEKGAEVLEARRVRPSLEEVFVQVTGIEAKAMKQEKEKGKMGGAA